MWARCCWAATSANLATKVGYGNGTHVFAEVALQLVHEGCCLCVLHASSWTHSTAPPNLYVVQVLTRNSCWRCTTGRGARLWRPVASRSTPRRRPCSQPRCGPCLCWRAGGILGGCAAVRQGRLTGSESVFQHVVAQASDGACSLPSTQSPALPPSHACPPSICCSPT